ncbi:MAG: primosomal protein DnaI [Bacilli bacterium]|nr:primosomal protein DnaI [Bacilli bacterium]
MNKIGNMIGKKNKINILKKNYMLALEDKSFIKLVNSLNATEETLMKNTSKLESSVLELKNCSTCNSLQNCKNKVKGYVYFPKVENENIVFSYKACKYTKKSLQDKNDVIFYETPMSLRNASLKNLHIDDKKRIGIIKYIKEFISKFETEEKLKGIYLHGSFGSGKSYILSALVNELSKKGYKCVNVYYPVLLLTLKESFNEDFNTKFNTLLDADILLIDDIGAENNTSWSRDEILGIILQYRMDNNKTTFFTSNLNLEELEEHLKIANQNSDKVKARRIIERIKYLSNEIELISENKRK